MTAISPYLRRPLRTFEEVVVGRRVTLGTGGPADPRELGTVQAAVPGKLLVRFGNRVEWLPLRRLEILS